MPNYTVVDEARDLIKPYVDTGDSAQESLTRSTVGFTGKNEAFSQENNAVIAHIKNGKSYKVRWTGSATVTLTKDTSSGTQVATGSTSPLSFTADADYDLYFGSSADVIEIMVWDARIKDSTYEPHHESVEVELIPIINKLRTDRRNISDKVSELSAAVQANDIYSAGFSIGDYFESPTAHELTQESWNAGTSTLSTSTVSVKFLYHLAHQNQYYGGYNNNAVIDKRTATILVDTKVNRQWHSGDAGAVGYSGSKLQTFLAGDVLDAIKADIAALTGDTWSDHLVAHNKLFTTGLGAWAWSNNQYISAPTESQFYGHTEWTANSFQEGEAVMQLELMRKYRWNEIFGNMWIWLRNMQAASGACYADNSGIAHGTGVVNAGRAAGLIEFH